MWRVSEFVNGIRPPGKLVRGSLLLVLLLGAEALCAQSVEYRIKAEFLERFTRFIEWPADSGVADRSQAFRLCVIGKNPFETYLQEMAEEIRIHGKHVDVFEVESEGVPSCDLLFISGSEDSRLESILARTDGKPILTVGDTESYARRGVLINLFNAGPRIQFRINPGAVKRSRLRFSSRLLSLGQVAEEERHD